MDEEMHKEYEEYMKQVTDNFVAIQSNEMTFLDIEWNSGLSWNSSKPGEIFRDGDFYENRKYNAEIAKKYLNENILTFEQWFKKYKTN